MSETFTKIGEAASGLWLAFTTKERIVVVYVGLFAILFLLGVSGERKRKREQEDLVEQAVRRAVSELRHG